MLELFDLDAFATRFADTPGIAALKPLIRAAISMSSVRNDLKRAREMMDACKSLSGAMQISAGRGGPIRRDQAATVQALFAQAVLLYTRATHSSGKGRNKLQITTHLGEEERAVHNRMTELRDRYFAHFGDASGWEAHRAVLALDIDGAKMALSYPHSSAYIQVTDAVAFERLLGVAVPIAQTQSDKISLRLNLALNELFNTDPELLERLRCTSFDHASLFQADEVQPYLDSVGTLDPDAPTEPRIGEVQRS